MGGRDYINPTHAVLGTPKFPEAPNCCSGSYHWNDAIIKTIIVGIRTTDGFRTLLAFSQKKSSCVTFSTSIFQRKHANNKKNDKIHPIRISNVLLFLFFFENVSNHDLTSSPEKQREHWRLPPHHCHKHNRLVLHPNHLVHSPDEFSPRPTAFLTILWSDAFTTQHGPTPKLLGPQSYPNRCSNRWHNSLWIRCLGKVLVRCSKLGSCST